MIEYAKFEKYMNDFKKLLDTEEKIDDSLRELSPEFGGFSLGIAIDLIHELLKDVMLDRYDNICYYIYELDWGTKWKKDSVTDGETGESIPLKNLNDLYDLIRNEAK